MRIGQVAPLYESVPPRYYGGTERIVSYLTEELVAQRHDVTLFASGDSQTQARLIAGSPTSLRLEAGTRDPVAVHVVLLEEVMRRADEFDVIHWHWDSQHFPLISRLGGPHLTTTHLRLDRPEWPALARHFPSLPLVSISHAQRAQLPEVNWIGTVHHGIPAGAPATRREPGRYLAFVGRLSPEKGVERAVEIARRVSMPLRIAAKIDEIDRDYFDRTVKPLLGEPGVEFVGEIGEHEKDEFLGSAYALLFPIGWPEPFGIVQIEAMARGTPTIAFRRGAVPEVTRDGVTGFVVDDVDQAVQAVHRVPLLDRAEIRRAFEASFTARRMADEYLALYRRFVEREPIGSVREIAPPPVAGEREAVPAGGQPQGVGIAANQG